MSRYIKTIAAILGAIGTWGVTASDEGITTGEYFGLLAAVGTALAVYALPNTNPTGPADPDVSEMDGPHHAY